VLAWNTSLPAKFECGKGLQFFDVLPGFGEGAAKGVPGFGVRDRILFQEGAADY